jgi:hypothetical protein
VPRQLGQLRRAVPAHDGRGCIALKRIAIGEPITGPGDAVSSTQPPAL